MCESARRPCSGVSVAIVAMIPRCRTITETLPLSETMNKSLEPMPTAWSINRCTATSAGILLTSTAPGCGLALFCSAVAATVPDVALMVRLPLFAARGPPGSAPAEHRFRGVFILRQRDNFADLQHVQDLPHARLHRVH